MWPVVGQAWNREGHAGEVETNNRWIGAKRGGEGGGAMEQGGELLQAEPELRWLREALTSLQVRIAKLTAVCSLRLRLGHGLLSIDTDIAAWQCDAKHQ